MEPSSSSANHATASSTSNNLPPPAARTNVVEATRHRAPVQLRLPTMNKDDPSFMEVANGCLKLKAHRMKRGDVGKAWNKIVGTLWNERSGKLRIYKKPADVSTFRCRFFKACESRCNRIQQPGQHSDSTDPTTGEEVPQADQVAEQIWMEYTSVMEAAKDKTEKLKKRKAAFKESSKALCPSSRSLVEIAVDKRVERVNQIVGNGTRTLSERQQNEVAVLMASELNGVSLVHAAASDEVDDDASQRDHI
eukprot:scaffold82331_cov51-Attheya_sp.AAC.1